MPTQHDDPTTRIRVMQPLDIPFGMALKGQAGWNQVEQDWARFLQLAPQGCFLAEHRGRPAGTVTTTIHGTAGWIGMMLVDANHRRQGIGARLLKHAIDHLQAQRVDAILLDASELGRPLYEQYGFRATETVTRFRIAPAREGSGPWKPLEADTPKRMETGFDKSIPSLDREAVGTDRRRWLDALSSERQVEWIRCESEDSVDLQGYASVRPGAHGPQIGPVIAKTQDVGLALIAQAILHSPQAADGAFIDLRNEHPAFPRLSGLPRMTPQRPFTRLAIGTPPKGDPNNHLASGGPEKG